MKNDNLANKIKDLRKRKGFSQEQLSENSKLSLRTIQRIENGESVPRGDTLIKLTQALEVTPDDLLEWRANEDRGYLILLNLSSVSIVFQPILGIIIPLVMWILKREKIHLVDDTGRKLVSFQITWILLLYTVLLIASNGLFIPLDFNILYSFYLLVREFTWVGFVIICLYGYNLTLIFVNVQRNQKGKVSQYLPAIPFLK